MYVRAGEGTRMNPDLMSVSDVADFTGLSRATICGRITSC